jgi:hypothetical protein
MNALMILNQAFPPKYKSKNPFLLCLLILRVLFYFILFIIGKFKLRISEVEEACTKNLILYVKRNGELWENIGLELIFQ